MKFILNNLNLNRNEISCFEAEMDSDQSRTREGGGEDISFFPFSVSGYMREKESIERKSNFSL